VESTLLKEHDAKALMGALIDNDDATVSRIVGAYFESAYRTMSARAGRSLMESISSSVSRGHKAAQNG